MTESFTILFEDKAALERELDSNLRIGGAFFRGALEGAAGSACEIVLVHPDDGSTLALPGRVVSIVPGGAGLAFEGFDAKVRRLIEEFVTPPDAGPVPAERTATAQERVRGLAVPEAQRIAREGEIGERVAVERLYGKLVWKDLLENVRVTVPEVARIARMGSLPLPLLEQIVNNRSWLGAGQVRRALLTNPRLSREQAARVLASLPRHELKVVPRQTTYTAQVRELARKLLQ
jgi:hypothetical protein